jgi:hypothetical protein
MDDYEFDIPLPDEHKKLLLNLVDKAKKYHVLSFYFDCRGSAGSFLYYLSFIFSADAGIKDSKDIELPENPILGFEILGFVKYDEEKHTVFLTPKLFKWASYEKKNRFGKFWVKLPNIIKDLMLVIAFMLSLALTAIEILQKFKVLPTP